VSDDGEIVDLALTDAAHDLLDHVQRFQNEHGPKAKPLTRMRAGMLAEALILEVDNAGRSITFEHEPEGGFGCTEGVDDCLADGVVLLNHDRWGEEDWQGRVACAVHARALGWEAS
jgi:hypothetical protein